MKSIIVPMFSITNASMQEAVGALQYASIQFDPRRGAGGPYGVGFVLLTPKDSGGTLRSIQKKAARVKNPRRCIFLVTRLP